MKPSPANDSLIEQTRRLWRSRLGRDVSCEDAQQIVASVTGFFSVLAEWSRGEMPPPANGAGKPIGSDTREHTMTAGKGKAELIDVKELLERDQDFVRAALAALLQAALEAEMTEAIGAEKGERAETRLSYRSGYYAAR
jgi:hypothetical protein